MTCPYHTVYTKFHPQDLVKSGQPLYFPEKLPFYVLYKNSPDRFQRALVKVADEDPEVSITLTESTPVALSYLMAVGFVLRFVR